MPDRPQVMIFSTHHMANPNADYIQTNYADVLAESPQVEIRALVTRLEGFAPTHVAVEVEPRRMAKVNGHYQRFLVGDYRLDRDEIDQVAFRLARNMGHTELYGVDHRQDLNLDEVFQYAEEHGLAAIKARITERLAELTAMQQRLEAEGTIIDLLRYLNSPDHDAFHQVYLQSALIGAGDTWVGAEMTATWYARNLKIYANIVKLVEHPGDRLFVLVGSGHAPLLREFLRQTPQIALVHPEGYLG